ncbi:MULTISPECIES: type II toxin-antitoxin system VapC family toxin [Burkholderia]|uniref:type II toxin-antitoxin system VapC family toxin n=1 Tax=Burkholderia TaxID=32008 RepID=UPI001E45CE53|nr:MULTISPECIES: PIN domain-containing protein [Burkholderia]
MDHLRAGDATLTALLEAERVLIHPFIAGELALGSMRNRATVPDALHDLPAATLATDDEVQRMIDAVPLHGLGIGYVDAHLLASTRLTGGSKLWTRDRRLLAAAERLQLVARPAHRPSEPGTKTGAA